MPKFLLATDLSERSDLALGRALTLAREHRAELFVAHVVDEDLPSEIGEVLKAEAARLLEARLEEQGVDDLEVAFQVAGGKPSVDVVRLAREREADLIILGQHGKGGLVEAFRGTTAERIIRTSDRPVLVVKAEARDGYRRAVIATDFSVHARRAAETAIRLAPQAEFSLVHGFLVPFEAFLHGELSRQQAEIAHRQQMARTIKEEMSVFLASLGGAPPRIRQVVRKGMAQTVILGEVLRADADLLVAGTHGRTGVAHAFLGSVAEDLLTEAPCDVLIARAW